ncbi:hypothetical protein ACPV3P_18505 [Photobacterium damselae]|uniref:hypothetical protein n=1 Tax=Photobacterium damselae TaxID=38293 RepID=UPI004068D56A
MGLEQQISSLVQASENLTGAVNNKIGEIDKHLAVNTAKIEQELAKIQTKLPRIIITRNQVLSLDTETGLPIGMAIHSKVTVTKYMTISGSNVKPAEQLALLQEMEQDMNTDLRKTGWYRQGFNILKMSWVNSPEWLAFPHAADDPNLSSIPVNTFLTLGAFVKVLTGDLNYSWAAGSQLGKWVFSNTKLNPAGFGCYANLHPIPGSPSGEVLVALPAAITGHIDSPAQWFPNINLG